MAVGIGESVVRSIAAPIFGSLLEGGGRAFNQLGDTLQQKIYLASKQYDQSYIERHGILKVLGMREPVLLESIYTNVQFLDHEAVQGFESIEALERIYRQRNQRSFQRTALPAKHWGLEVANQQQYLMVLGGPGIGKSTFLRKIGLEALKGKQDEGFQHECIPVFIELKGFRSGRINLEETISEVFRIRGFPDPQRFTLTALERGKLLILLDGLDEVPSDRLNEVITTIQNFVDRYDKNRYIASCRLAAYRHNFRRFTDATIASFSNNQIQNFIYNWFSTEPERGRECWQKLMSEDYAAAKELTHTPLLLTLVCLLYQRAGQFPTNRATLYEKALRVLLEEWAGEKGIPQEIVYKGLDTKRKELMLSEIAYHAFKEDRLFLSKREIADQIEQVLKEMLPREQYIDGITVLKSIEIQHGILVERAEGIYSFSHLTFQEFLTAQHIVGDRHRVEDLVAHYLTDSRWREVFLLLAGLQRADELLLQMESLAKNYIQSPNLKNLLNWAQQITSGSESDYKPAAKRAVALFLALDLTQSIAVDSARVQALDLDIDHVRELALEIDESLSLDRAIDIVLIRALNLEHAIDLAIAIARKFEELKIFQDVNFTLLIAKLHALKAKVPQYQESPSARRIFIEQINQTWLDAIKLRREWIRGLSRQEVSALDQYLSTNLLIVQCRKAAVRVSPRTWSLIENGLLQIEA